LFSNSFKLRKEDGTFEDGLIFYDHSRDPTPILAFVPTRPLLPSTRYTAVITDWTSHESTFTTQSDLAIDIILRRGDTNFVLRGFAGGVAPFVNLKQAVSNKLGIRVDKIASLQIELSGLKVNLVDDSDVLSLKNNDILFVNIL
jgi:hypothetical protein